MKSKILLSSYIPFPPVSWWQLALRHDYVLLDAQEHFQKMSFRNRYYLSGSQGKQMMSIPVSKGRNQRMAMKNVHVDMRDNWQIKHWRTIFSNYGRAPYFEYFSDDIEALFEPLSNAQNLTAWSKKGILKISELLGVKMEFKETENFILHYPEEVLDIRFLNTEQIAGLGLVPEVQYHQVFQDRTGFINDCSVLDLLFCEGRNAVRLLK